MFIQRFENTLPHGFGKHLAERCRTVRGGGGVRGGARSPITPPPLRSIPPLPPSPPSPPSPAPPTPVPNLAPLTPTKQASIFSLGSVLGFGPLFRSSAHRGGRDPPGDLLALLLLGVCTATSSSPGARTAWLITWRSWPAKKKKTGSMYMQNGRRV